VIYSEGSKEKALGLPSPNEREQISIHPRYNMRNWLLFHDRTSNNISVFVLTEMPVALTLYNEILQTEISHYPYNMCCHIAPKEKEQTISFQGGQIESYQ
jgi:hypothetical protein